jgi:hypothetical protein
MRVKIYRKIIHPIIRYAHDEFPPSPYTDSWYDDDEFIRMGIEEKFERESDCMSWLEWEEKFVECGTIDR